MVAFGFAKTLVDSLDLFGVRHGLSVKLGFVRFCFAVINKNRKGIAQINSIYSNNYLRVKHSVLLGNSLNDYSAFSGQKR